MVTSWILNTIYKELVKRFIYTTFTKEPWLEIAERYDECNEPMVYKLQSKIASISQENASVSMYFIILKQLWGKFNNMKVLPSVEFQR